MHAWPAGWRLWRAGPFERLKWRKMRIKMWYIAQCIVAGSVVAVLLFTALPYLSLRINSSACVQGHARHGEAHIVDQCIYGRQQLMFSGL